MPKGQSLGALNGAISDILKSAPKGAASARNVEADFRAIAGRDYAATVKRHFDRAQLQQILKEVRKTLPTLNREVYRITEIDHLSRIAADMGVVLQARPFKGSDGAGFRGFYVNEAEVLKRPLIWINTASHPAAAAAAFWHEVGHHLTNELWGTRHQPVSMWAGPKYSDHLTDPMTDPKEIAADMVRILGGYPKPIAERLFGGPNIEASSRDADLLVAKARPHVRAVMGFDFQSSRSPGEVVFYLGGMIHTAKLRTTLLTEYGI